MSMPEMTLEPAPIHVVPISDQLKRKRLDRGFDLADVARETRIPLRHLNALETGDFNSLPALAYSVGFVRTYARYLGLDPDAVARDYKMQTTQMDSTLTAAAPEMDPESRLPSRKLVLGSLGALAAVVGAFVAVGLLRSGDEAETPEAENVAITAPDQSVAAAPVLSDTAAPPVAETIAPPAPVSDPALATTTAPLPATGTAVPALPSASGPVIAGVPSVGLVIRAVEDSWIKVTDGGPVSLKIGILKAGETYSVPQVPGLRLQTGNAGGVELIYNGRALPSLGGKGVVIRNQSLDPAQLMAPATR
jgi:cytoskeleton protein RodZ